MAAKSNALIINDVDNVAVATQDIGKGERVYLANGRELRAADDIPYSHKIALRDIDPGQDIIKYGEVIGQAGEDIKAGSWIHTHNLLVKDEGKTE